MRYLPIALWLLASVGTARAEWRALTTDLLAKHKPGYGGLSGVVVDRANGHLYVDLSDLGIFRSTDLGKTWERVGQALKGRTETPGCFQLDPTGKSKRLLLPTVYNGPIQFGTTDGDWKALDKASSHVDWCAIDWSAAEPKFMLTLKHEKAGLMLVSHDGGKSFAEVGKGYGFGWIFDDKTAVVSMPKAKERAKGGLVRTTDAGKTFEPVGDYDPPGLPRWHAGTLYWVTKNELIKSADKGANWTKVSALKDARYGPVFGKSDKHLFVLTGAGIVESTDAGATWSAPLAPPKELKGVSGLTWLEYDPVGDVLYIMKMTSELYAWQRGR